MRVIPIIFSLLFAMQSTMAGMVNITDYGAVADSSTINTHSIQRAVDACYNQGGGMVVIPAGKFISGTIVLRSNVILHLEPGAYLFGSVELKDFPKTKSSIRSYTDNYTNTSLIYAENATNIGITGRGIIDGRGWHSNYQGKPYLKRPYMIRMIGCKRIQIRDVLIKDSPMWVQHYLSCDDIVIDGITVESRTANHNNDGIDIDGCHNVRISNCLINSLDDAIVLKSTLSRKCRNIVITNCVLSSHCNAFKLGTETNGGFDNVTFSNSVIRNTRMSGIALELVDGGSMKNIMISNIVMDSLFNPIFIRLGNRARPHQKEGPLPGIGSIDGISIDGIRATNIGKYRQPGSEDGSNNPDWKFIPSSITGMPDYPPTNITLRNIYFEYPGGYDEQPDPGKVNLNETSYPEFGCMGILPASVMYVRHVKGLTIDNVSMKVLEEDVRPVLFLHDVADIEIEKATINGKPLGTEEIGTLHMPADPKDER